MIGRYGASVGQIHRGKAGAYNVALIKATPDENAINREFFYLYLNSAYFQTPLAAVADRSAQAGFSKEDISNFEVPLPPLPEQQRIVAILEEAFAGLATSTANAEKNLRSARALFESQLQFVFTQRAAAWKEYTLDQICSFSSGGTPSKSNLAYWKGEIPWVSGRDMKTDRLDDAALHISREAIDDSATRVAPVGALLILVRGMGLANGIAIAELTSPCAFNQDIKAIHPNAGIDPRFLLFSLRSALSRSDKLLSNAAHGTLKIDTDDLRSVPLLIPPRNVQQHIVAQIDDLSLETQSLANLYRQKVEALELLKKSLLQKAFSGELAPPPSQAIGEAAE
jgi:type I restriction enzyme S subunit